VARVVADGNGLVEAISADLLGEHGDILRAVVDDAGEAIAVDEDFGGGVEAVFAGEGAGVEDEAVGDAAVDGEVLAAAALKLFGRGPARDDEPPDSADEQDDAGGDGSGDAGVMPDCVEGRRAKGLP